VRAARTITLVLLVALCEVAGYGLAGPPGLTALVVTALTAAVVAGVSVAALANGARIARAVTTVPLISRAAGMREKSWCAGFLRQRDPDAAGRVRPRAPTAAPAAA